MTFFISKYDTQLAIYRSKGSSLTGFQSKYKDIPVPATGNKIAGFPFDDSFWRSDIEENNQFIVPTLWDPLSNTPNLFQSGIGDNDDLLIDKIIPVNKNNKEVWAPRIEHGYYYTGLDEFYLYSDDAIILYPQYNNIFVSTTGVTTSGGNYININLLPKIGIPIKAITWQWNEENGYYQSFLEAAHVSEFTSKIGSNDITSIGSDYLWDNINTSRLEFLISDSNKFVFNQQVVRPHGRILPNISSYNSSELEAMELVGSTLDSDFQEHHLKYSPVASGSPIQVVVENGTTLQELTIVKQFTVSGSNEVIVDNDLGLLLFGSSTLGGKPPSSYNIRVGYSSTVGIEYEPINTRDTITNVAANINSITRFNANGFIFIKQQSNDVSSISLSSELNTIDENYYGPLYVGNNFSKVIATIKDKNGNPIEGQKVYFSILNGPEDINFGTGYDGSAITASDGTATVLLNPPRSINQMGGITNQITVSGSDTYLTLNGYNPPTDLSSLFLFQIHTSDDILGIPKSDLLSFYESYIQQQDTVSGQNKGPLITWSIGDLGDYSWITGAYSNFIKWEILHREIFNLETPTAYEPDDLRTGKKTVIAVFDSDAINPHTGTNSSGAFVPLQPSAFTSTNTGSIIKFNYVLPAIGSTIKSYLVVGPTKVTIQAYTINERNGQVIYSSPIDILIDIPNSSNGLIQIDTINSIPSGLLGNAINWDQENIPLDPVQLTSSGLLPLGWRLRSPGITIASALDSITFLDINPLDDPS